MTFQVIAMPPRTLAWWRDERDEVDLDPVYQRKGHIWSEKQQQYLIDSIINGFDIPKLYVADFTFLDSKLNIKKKKYAVIDGKQRLTTILNFFDGLLVLSKDFLYLEDPALKVQGFSYGDLAKNYPKIARRFDNMSLTVMSVITDDEADINELFIRLNSSKPLTGAELRNAMSGIIPQLIRNLAGHTFFTNRIKFNVVRSQDRNTAAKLLLLEHRGTIVDTKKAQLDALTTEAFSIVSEEATDADEARISAAFEEAAEETQSTNVEQSASRTRTILDRLTSIFIEADELLRRQADIIVIYWLVRSTDPGLDKVVRPFLIKFELDRSANKAHKSSEQKNPEINEYELMARTSNDAGSIRIRHQILRRRFASYCKELGIDI